MNETTKIPDGYTIRRGELTDIPALQRADVAASALFVPTGLIDEDPGDIQPIPAEVLRAGVESNLLFVTTNPFGDPVGFVVNRIQSPDLYLDQLSVDPAHGKRGLGRALVETAIHEASDRGLKGVVLSTFRDLAWNGPFYAKLGFEELPRKRLKSWMLELEERQAKSMDVSLRCFMRRPDKGKGLFARKVRTKTPQ